MNKTSYLSILVSMACLLLPTLGEAEEPWGKDVELCLPRCRETCEAPSRNDPLVRLTRAVIGFHKGVISPADGPRSHFKPSSSEYMLQAVEKYGFLRGYLMGCDRLMRENKDPWIYRTTENKYHLITKWDPVP